MSRHGLPIRNAVRPLGLFFGTTALLASLFLLGCSSPSEPTGDVATGHDGGNVTVGAEAARLGLAKYRSVKLTTDLPLRDQEKELIGHLIEAAEAMEPVFWQQAYGDQQALTDTITDPSVLAFVEANFGPWDRLAGNAPFIEGVGEKPAGANLYPADITAEELEAAIEAATQAGDEDHAAALSSLYTLVRRDDAGALVTIPYSEAFAAEFTAAAEHLRAAAALAEDPGLKKHLELRADALLSDDYLASDIAWMEMKNNPIDIVIGPIETYEDQLAGYKAAAEAYVLVKDQGWSERLARYAGFLPELQRGLPVEDAYKAEMPGAGADLNAYDVVYVAGDSNAGSKTIAINLPNDERVQLEFGTRRLQLKNAMRAKFDHILEPLAGMLIAEDQRQHVTFDAFFGNTMFHEVAHGLGIKNTLDGENTVRRALKEQASAMEEGKADVLGLYMVSQLHDKGEITDTTLEDNLVTFVASIFRSIRFGASSAHGRANVARFNFFTEQEAFVRDDETGTWRVDFEKMRTAMDALSARILTLQGDGDYDGAKEFFETYGQIGDGLQADLDRLQKAGIPVDIVYEQGPEVLGL